LSGRLAELAG